MTRLPGWRSDGDGPHRFVTAMAAWAYSAALADLVDHFGGGPVPQPLDAGLRYLDDFSAAVWDFRGGRERHQSVAPEFSADTVDRVRRHAGTLGLSGPADHSRPRRYDHVLVLGGRARACVLRSRFAAELLRAGVTAGDVVGLGSLRPVDDAERRHAADLGGHPADTLATEFDAMDLALTDAFELTTATATTKMGGVPPDDPRTGWRVRTYPGTPRVRLLAAPSSQPQLRRANTADTLTFWARTAGITAAHRLLLVTSALYVPFQHCDAVRVLGLPFGCAVDTVGTEQPPGTDAATLLQEIRSAIRSMMLLHRAFVAAVR